MDVVELVDRSVDLARRKVWMGESITPLTDQEAALLAYLAARPGQVVPRDELLERVWGYAGSVVTRAVDAAVRRLRNKIEADAADPVHLLTVHGVGYRFEPVQQSLPGGAVAVAVDWGDALRDLDDEARTDVVAVAHAALDEAARRHGGTVAAKGPESVEVTFVQPLSAARFAVAVQLDLHAASWPEALDQRPRIRPLVGPVDAWRGLPAKVGAAAGPDASTVARRLCAAAWAGQIVLASTLAAELGDPRDLGAIAAPRPGRAVGLADDVVELLPVELAGRRFPSRGGPPVPDAVDAFVGRRDRLVALREAVAAHRLVTVTGPAGAGKTRLATELARRWAADGRVWICGLAAAASLGELLHAVADQLGVPLRGVDPATGARAIGLALAGRGSELVILDDFERFAEHAADTVGAWREAAPEMTFVVTSRHRLGLPGERVVELGPLGIDEALALFEARVPAGTMLDRADHEIVAAIVERLDRLPLAIELAAARTRVLAPRDLLEHLSKSVEARFAVLRQPGGKPAASLWGALDASWQLLDDAERHALGCCAVFRGSFDLAAASSLLPGEPDDPFAAGDVLDRLRDRSLLQAQRGPTGRVRFTMLPTVRDHAWSRLDDAARAHARALHRAHYARFGDEPALARFAGPDSADWLAERAADVPDLVAALQSAACDDDRAAAVPLALGLAAVAGRVGVPATAIEAVDPVLDVVDTERDRSRVQAALSALLDLQGDPRATALAAEALVAAERDGGVDVVAAAHLQLGRSKAYRADEIGARGHFEAARDHARRAGDRLVEAQAIGALANVDSKLGETDVAEERYQQADSLFEQLGDARGRALVAANLAAQAADRGDLIRARDGFATAIAYFRASGDAGLVAHVQCNLGNVLTAQGDMERAEPVLREALETSREIGNERIRGRALLLLGELLVDRGELDEADALLASAIDVLREVGDLRSLGLALVARGTGLVGRRSDEARSLVDAGLATHRRIGDPRSIAFALVQRSRLAIGDGDRAAADRALEEAEELARGVGDALTLALVHCQRGEHLVDQDPAAARRYRDQAEEARVSLGLGEQSELGRALARLSTRIGP